ncbi:MAG TPA: MSMEG_6728 family protein, partial [Actinomycetota bacterium]|nr:MSMEG_6728 family protein [Actinomycetota bacterium]
MQTFLPYPDFAASAQALDPRRLGKQRVEALQVLQGLTQPGYAWRHHPAVRMWRGHEEALGTYGVTVCRAWFALGFADTCELQLREELDRIGVA